MPEMADERLHGLVVALWRQVARDVASGSPTRRALAIAWLDSEMASVWAIRYDPDIDPDIIIQAVLAGGRAVRPTRHTAARPVAPPPERVA